MTESITQDLTTLRAVIDSLPDAAFVVDTDWRIRLFNRRAQQLIGLTESDVFGRICQHVLNADACAAYCPLAITLRSGHSQFDHRVTVHHADGSPLNVSVNTSVWLDDDGKAAGGVVTLRDLTPVTTLCSEPGTEQEFCGMIGAAPAMRELFQQVKALRKSRATILIRGDSGTGKERLARAIHTNSTVSDGPFLAVSCGAIPDTLLESELFGHRKGAFTDAKHHHSGYFERASGGTLFLDEIGEASPLLQVKLLRVLEEHRITPVGGEQSFPVQVRVIAASHRDLAQEVAQGNFRSDLYHRLAVVPLEIPPLRERSEDVPLMVEEFLAQARLRKETEFQHISAPAIRRMQCFPWPGNVRQLENAVAYGVAIGEGEMLEERFLPPYLLKVVPDARIPQAGIDAGVNPLLLALAQANNKVAVAAKLLGISRVTFWRRLKALQASNQFAKSIEPIPGSIVQTFTCPPGFTPPQTVSE
ncbi:MAG: sigma 54-interacting transcriptional regulator [bacterium]|nr:sigma 54-interacting transcriptional regulator [bacterium]